MEEGVDYDKLRWLTAGDKTVGLIVKTDSVTGEKFVYIAAVPGYDEQKDIKYILEWGSKIPVQSVLDLIT